MEHTRKTVEAALTEPPDGAALIIDNGDDEWRVIWRDDQAADEWYDGDARGQHWWHATDEDPMELYQHLKYADRVFALPKSPIAVLNRGVFQ